ncbi:hypothetical protein SAMN02745116_01196 [Pilibacter termitis]|uniref:Uncharacterized protein n=1 Tax=Pilibacter termitis TaxID=263852 RepID=A0A1T4MRW2_9ENTE|nr:hypothetical protein [Pilibacter termitis]SJZ69820.1 hypothetical protein SAMN02745116_01196 [Pilibacter termitis]
MRTLEEVRADFQLIEEKYEQVNSGVDYKARVKKLEELIIELNGMYKEKYGKSALYPPERHTNEPILDLMSKIYLHTHYCMI